MQNLWIYGTGGHFAVVRDVITNMDDFNIFGYIDDDVTKEGRKLCGHEIIGGLQKFKNSYQDPTCMNMFLAIGDNLIREKLAIELSGYNFPIVIHPSAIIGHEVNIGSGTIIMPGAIVEARAKIGEHCIINNRAIIGHGSIVEDFCHISGGAILTGNTVVQRGSLIAVGAYITQSAHVGKYCKIGAGSVITKNVPDGKFMFGIPARVINNYLIND